jgi:hypothetical protein
MRHWSDRAQTEPLAALAAVLAVTAGLTIYAGTLDRAVSPASDRRIAETTLQRVTTTIESTGVTEPSRLTAADDAIPDGWHGNVTLRTDDRRWANGPRPPSDSDSATRRLSVRVSPMEIRPGRLRVVVWQ